MSSWTYIDGVITVSPMGRTPAESRYILETVLNHLPIVSGSEDCMRIDIIDLGTYGSCSCNEFGECYERPNLKGRWGSMFECDAMYKLVLTGKLRDRYFNDTYKSFLKWLIRLAKRVWVSEALVRVSGHDFVDGHNSKWLEYSKILNYPNGLYELLESPSWSYDVTIDKDGFPSSTNWCEYLMWDNAEGYDMPINLFVRKYKDREVDEEWLRRFHYHEPYRRRKHLI